MRPTLLLCAAGLLAGCLPPPNPRTVDISAMPNRQAEQVLANHQDRKTPWITITGETNLAEALAR